MRVRPSAWRARPSHEDDEDRHADEEPGQDQEDVVEGEDQRLLAHQQRHLPQGCPLRVRAEAREESHLGGIAHEANRRSN